MKLGYKKSPSRVELWPVINHEWILRLPKYRAKYREYWVNVECRERNSTLFNMARHLLLVFERQMAGQ